MGAYRGTTLFIVFLATCLYVNGENEAAVAVSVTSAPPVNTTTTAKSVSQKTLRSIANGVTRLENKMEKLTNKVQLLQDSQKLSKILEQLTKKKIEVSKTVKGRRGASVAASAGRGGSSVAVSASRRANLRKLRKTTTTTTTTTTAPPNRKLRSKRKHIKPTITMRKNKRGGTSVSVSAGDASASSSAGRH